MDLQSIVIFGVAVLHYDTTFAPTPIFLAVPIHNAGRFCNLVFHCLPI